MSIEKSTQICVRQQQFKDMQTSKATWLGSYFVSVAIICAHETYSWLTFLLHQHTAWLTKYAHMIFCPFVRTRTWCMMQMQLYMFCVPQLHDAAGAGRKTDIQSSSKLWTCHWMVSEMGFSSRLIAGAASVGDRDWNIIIGTAKHLLYCARDYVWQAM